MQYQDVALVNNSLDKLGEALLRDRIQREAEQQNIFARGEAIQARAERENDRMVDQGLKNREQNWRENPDNPVNKEAAWRQDPNNPENKRLTAMANAKYTAQWLDNSGVARTAQGSQDDIASAMKVAPPSPSQKMTFRFVTESGAEATFKGTPDEMKTIAASHPELKPTKQENRWDPAAVKVVRQIADYRNQADDIEEQDPDQAQYMRGLADLLENHLQKNPPKSPVLRKTVKRSTADGTETLSGPADQVDAAGGAGGAGLKFVRDPKTGRLIPVAAPAPVKK